MAYAVSSHSFQRVTQARTYLCSVIARPILDPIIDLLGPVSVDQRLVVSDHVVTALSKQTALVKHNGDEPSKNITLIMTVSILFIGHHHYR
jgi:hypothetical protein